MPQLSNNTDETPNHDTLSNVAKQPDFSSEDFPPCKELTQLIKKAESLQIELAIHTSTQRPHIPTVAGSILETDTGNESKLPTLLVACGPQSFCDDARETARQRNVEYSEEAFEW